GVPEGSCRRIAAPAERDDRALSLLLHSRLPDRLHPAGGRDRARLGGASGDRKIGMAKTKTASKKKSRKKEPPRPPLPDPRIATGPYRPFASDPSWDEAWWWLGIPLAFALLVIVTGGFAPEFYGAWIIPEGYGVLEFTQFIVMIGAFVLAVRLLFDP